MLEYLCILLSFPPTSTRFLGAFATAAFLGFEVDRGHKIPAMMEIQLEFTPAVAHCQIGHGVYNKLTDLIGIVTGRL